MRSEKYGLQYDRRTVEQLMVIADFFGVGGTTTYPLPVGWYALYHGGGPLSHRQAERCQPDWVVPMDCGGVKLDDCIGFRTTDVA